MNNLLAITAIGEDRPGIVDDLTSILLENNLNIEDSHMCVLGGEFAIILLVTGSAAAITHIQQQHDQLEQALRLNLLIKPTQEKQAPINAIAYNLKVVGMDHPGIVNRLSRFLSSRNINIEDLETDSYPAPHTGTPMFSVNMIVDIPNDLATSKLRDEFMELCDEQNLDAHFSPLEAP
ncbi:MAG: glycine cleavage system protein R [Gammaproteobacteria bacterium]|nr:glycine cleavage system protein R [Gammaproteobacteria bacterium]